MSKINLNGIAEKMNQQQMKMVVGGSRNTGLNCQRSCSFDCASGQRCVIDHPNSPAGSFRCHCVNNPPASSVVDKCPIGGIGPF